MKDADMADAIVRFAFTYIENTFMSPVWWAGLPKRHDRPAGRPDARQTDGGQPPRRRLARGGVAGASTHVGEDVARW